MLWAMADTPKQINFTIVPDDSPNEPRTYANFCSIAHTPFDFTLTFCEVMPLSDKEIKEAAESTDKPNLSMQELRKITEDYARDWDLGPDAHPCDMKSSIDPSGRVRSGYVPPPVLMA